MPRDAEAWLAERGIRREPIRVPRDPDAEAPAQPVPSDPSGSAASAPAASASEAHRLAGQAAADAALVAADARAYPDPQRHRLEDDVAEAMAFVRRSTAVAPQSEGRLRAKLTDRGWPTVVVEQALIRARRERLVDDGAMAAALVEERRAKGHAVARIRRDLRERGFEDDVLDRALAAADAEDPRAAAFAVARERAAGLTSVPTDVALRRVAAFVARRGYPEGLARKVARDAVFATRDPERTAGH